jgi:aminobenzoyl-glutamate transport protein
MPAVSLRSNRPPRGDLPPRRSVLDWIEQLGNRLPEPAILFAILAGAVVAISAVGSALDWTVQPVTPVLSSPSAAAATAAASDAATRSVMTLVPSGPELGPRSLLSIDGVYWMFSSMLRNFASMPALPLLFVAMLGIGLAERFGLFRALMRSLALRTPRRWLTPVTVFIGANSSIASDAGYVVLPPLAAALFLAAGRHPVAGLAAAFAGVAGGFGAGLFPTGGDGVIAGFAQDAARVIDPSYSVSILHNLYFKALSAIVVTLVGWYVTDRLIEPRLLRQSPEEARADDPAGFASLELEPTERRALRAALATMAGLLAVFVAISVLPGMPLHGDGKQTLPNGRVLVQQAVTILPADHETSAPAFDILTREPFLIVEKESQGRLVETPGPRWSQSIVPMVFLLFLLPGLVYGRLTGQLRRQSDFTEAVHHGIRDIVPVLVILFFLAQFTNYLTYSNLDRMLAYAGGQALFEAALPTPLLLVLFVLVVIIGDFAMSGMLSKFGVLAPIAIPMFMMVGLSPELTTAAYRIGDSVVNIITPLNSYALIILAMFQKYRPRAGLGTLIALMVPYSIALAAVWTAALLLWLWSGVDLGPGSPLGLQLPAR